MTNVLTGAERFIAQWRQSTAEGNLYSPDDLTAYILGIGVVPGNGRQVSTLSTYLLNNAVFNVVDFGAKGNGVADDAAALAAAATAALAVANSGGRPEVYIPAGHTCLTNSVFTLPAGVSMRIDGAIMAGTSIAAVIQTPLADLSEDCYITGGGKILCNSLASTGIDLQFTRHFGISNVVIEDALVTHILCGNSAASSSSYETTIRNVRLHRPSATVPAGSIGIRLRAASDCNISDTVVVGAETGVQMETGGNQLSNVHCWVRASTGVLKVGFYDAGSLNGYINCYADCPTQYGWWIQNRGGQRIMGCTAYNNAGIGLSGVDNAAYAIRFEHANPNAMVLGLNITGQNTTSRFLGDFSFAGANSDVTIWGTALTNVTNVTPFQMGGGNKLANTVLSGVTQLTGQTNISDQLVLLQTGSTMPDFDNVADSSDGATLVTTTGSVISSLDSTRRVWRFRKAGTGKAGTGGIAFGEFDTSDLLLHSLIAGQIRLDSLDYTVTPNTLTNLLICDPNGLSWNGGAKIKKHKTATTTWDPPSVAAGAQTTSTISVSGVVLGDIVSVSFNLDLQGMQLTGYVSTAGVVTVVLRNGTAGAIDLASGTLRASVWQY